MAFNTIPGNILFPAGTTIIDGTYQIRQSTNAVYSVAKTAVQFLADEGISLTTFNETLNLAPNNSTYFSTDFSYTEIDMLTGQNDITYPDNSSWFLKFNMQYPTGKVVAVIIVFTYQNIPA